MFTQLFKFIILCLPADLKLSSTHLERRTLAFTPVSSPTLMELHPATISLSKAGTRFNNHFSFLTFRKSLFINLLLSLTELKRLLEVSHDHKFPSEYFSLTSSPCCV